MTSKKLLQHPHLQATGNIHIVNDGPDDVFIRSVTPDHDGEEQCVKPGGKTYKFVTATRGFMVYTKKT